jgi:hypothetical protein
MVKVIYNGSVMLLKGTPANLDLIKRLQKESEERHLRFEVRCGRFRKIFYYDYDKPKEDE